MTGNEDNLEHLRKLRIRRSQIRIALQRKMPLADRAYLEAELEQVNTDTAWTAEFTLEYQIK